MSAPLLKASVALASRLEQEIRAHPRLHDAFYRLATRTPLFNSTVGRAKAAVRGAQADQVAVLRPEDSPRVNARREAAVAASLGLSAVPER